MRPQVWTHSFPLWATGASRNCVDCLQGCPLEGRAAEYLFCVPACHWWRAAHGSLVPQHFRPALECEPFRFLFPQTQPSGRELPGSGGKKGVVCARGEGGHRVCPRRAALTVS